MDAAVRQDVQRGLRQAEQLEAELRALPVGSLLEARTDLVDRIMNIVGAFTSAVSHLQSSIRSSTSSHNSSSTTSGSSCLFSEEEAAGQEQQQQPEQQQPSPKKKRTTTTTTITTAVVSDSFPDDDGHFWRKYGQKEILGSRFPRSYYRCRRKRDSGCPAIKYVQRSDSHPSVFHVTYRGKHSCGSTTKQQQQQSPVVVNSACLRMNSDGGLQLGPWGPTLFHPTITTTTATMDQCDQLSPFDLDFALDNSTEVLSIEDACLFDHSIVGVV